MKKIYFLLLITQFSFAQTSPQVPVFEGVNATSAATVVSNVSISSANPVICGSNTNAVLQASPVNSAFTYQ